MTSALVAAPIGAAIAELEKTRALYQADLAQIDETLGSLRRIGGRGAKPERVPKPKPKRKPSKAGGVSRKAKPVHRAKSALARKAPAATRTRGLDAATVAKVKAIVGTSGLRAAAEATGLKYNRIWNLATTNRWKVAPTPKGPVVAAKASPKPGAKLSPGLRVCPKCKAATRSDPCNLCGAPAPKS